MEDQLESVQAQLRGLEQTLKASTEHKHVGVQPGIHQPCPSSDSEPSTQLDPAPGDYDWQLLERQYQRLTNYLPIFASSKVTLLYDRLVGSVAWSIVVETLQSVMVPTSCSTDIALTVKFASQHLRKAQSLAAQSTLEPPGFCNMQALLLLVAGMRRSFDDGLKHKASMLLAISANLAHQLKLHQLDGATGISAKDRLEMIRAFWCLYIMDRENSLRKGEPLLLDDEDTSVLEPRKQSDDSFGLVLSQSGGASINLFAARQRLARIMSKIHKQLCTFRSTHRATAQRAAAARDLTTELVSWKQQWFDCGPESEWSNVWPDDALLSISNLNSTYLLCCSKTNRAVSEQAI